MQKTALVVDDSRVARMTLKKLLSAYQFEVVELGSGEDALEYLLAENRNPDIIFMDVMMGGMDGLTATKQIKDTPVLSDIPVIICTGNDSEEDRNKALEVGAVTALTKPPVADVLAGIIAKVERSAPTIKEEPAEQPAATVEIDQAALIHTILAKVEQSILPKMQKNTREIAEDISRQVAGDTTEKVVEETIKAHMDTALAGLNQQLTSQTERIAEKVAQQASTVVVQESAIESATKAVQIVVDDADITTQVSQFLSDKGEEWLADQEEDLGTQLTAQIDQLIPSLVTEHLDAKLEAVVASIIASNMPSSTETANESTGDHGLTHKEVEALINLTLHQHSNTVVSPIVSNMVNKQLAAQALLEQDEEALDVLTGHVTRLKYICFGLGVAVVGLFITAIL